MEERQFDNFDEFAGDYRHIHSENIKATGADSSYFAEFKPKKLASIFKKLNFNPAQIVDVGCGDGEVVKFLSAYFPLAQIQGIDISAESIAAAEKRGIERATFRVYDGLKLPFANASIDFVLIANVLHHVEHRLHFGLIGEIKRMLRTDGFLAVWEHNPLNPITVKIVNDCVFDEDAVLMRNTHVTGILRKQEWKEIDTRFQLFFPRSAFFRPFHHLEPIMEWCPLGGQYLVLAKK